MSKQNSLCFPCLEKVRTKFPVFPVPWPPCKLHSSKSAISIWETDKKVRYKHFIFEWIWLNVYLQKCTDIAEKWDKFSISIQDIQISGLRAITTFPKKAFHKEINFLWNCSTSGIQIHSSSSLWRKSNQSSDLEFLIQDSSQRGIYFYDVGGTVRSPFFIWKKVSISHHYRATPFIPSLLAR